MNWGLQEMGDVSTTLRSARHDGDFFDEWEDEEDGEAALLILYQYCNVYRHVERSEAKSRHPIFIALTVMSSGAKRSRDILKNKSHKVYPLSEQAL